MSGAEPTVPHGSAVEPELAGPARARQLFRYLGGDEWNDYRAIMSVFADTFFSEFTPDDVVERLAQEGAPVEPEVVPARLESLRRWGNLTVSTSIGNPSSLDDYYRRRNLYLITREGQEVHGLVEGVLHRVDEVGDVQSGRLRDLRQRLVELRDLVDAGLQGVVADELADRVRAVFDPHESFTLEITQFFAALNQWQSRYDLDPEDLQFFAEILVGYVSEQLSVIERSSRPISVVLDQLEPALDEIVARMRTGLAARVDAAGLGEQITIRRVAGSQRSDWNHLARWFRAPPGGRSRLDELTVQALSAVRTLTANLTRLSGIGMGSTSRRADFVRLARFLAEARGPEEAHQLATAAFGLVGARHVGVESGDADDPVPSSTSWSDGPKVAVPVAMRERGDTSMRGRASPMRDRSQEKQLLRLRREQEAARQQRTSVELLEAAGRDGSIDGAELSAAAFTRLQDLIGRSSHRLRAGQTVRTVHDEGVTCQVIRRPGTETVVSSPEGRLRLLELEVLVTPTAAAEAASKAGAAAEAGADGGTASPVGGPTP